MLPAISTDVLMLSCVIDAMEVQNVAIADIPVDFLQTDYNKGEIHINIKGTIVTLFHKIDLSYYKVFIYIYSSGKKFMYAESKKSFYSTLEASLLFW